MVIITVVAGAGGEQRRFIEISCNMLIVHEACDVVPVGYDKL
ncbi:MAG: hypothetical protein R2912_06305 [Eubacteriales bacterium]